MINQKVNLSNFVWRERCWKGRGYNALEEYQKVENMINKLDSLALSSKGRWRGKGQQMIPQPRVFSTGEDGGEPPPPHQPKIP